MDREICVLVYSEFSPASKQIVDYIQSLPYDIAAITGMTLLAADTNEIRKSLGAMNISYVPCIYIKYFNGKTSVYSGQQVYSFIDAITAAITSAAAPAAAPVQPRGRTQLQAPPQQPQPQAAPSEVINLEEDDMPKIPEGVVKKGNVMAAAAAMQKVREESSIMPTAIPKNKTKLM